MLILSLGFVHATTLEEIAQGLWTIWSSPALLPSDYIAMVGLGSAFVNASLAGGLALSVLKLFKTGMGGLQMGAMGLVIGFAFFGKNPANMLPILLGGYIYARYKKEAYRNHVTISLFATCLGPIVSQPAHTQEILAHLGTMSGVILGILIGLAIGFFISPIAGAVRKYHEGRNLYNVGWAAGLLAMSMTLVYVILGVEPFVHYIAPWGLTDGRYNRELYIFLVLTTGYFWVAGGVAIWQTGEKIYPKELLSMKADDNHFYQKYGAGYTYLAMGTLGLLALAVTLLFRVNMNAAILGAILSMIGWGGFGKSVVNSTIIIAGVILGATFHLMAVSIFFPLSGSGATMSFSTFYTTNGVIWSSAFWGTCLSPMVKHFGWKRGILVGMMHFFVASNIASFHWGQNLYNNGLAAGLVCVVLLWIFRVWDKFC